MPDLLPHPQEPRRNFSEVRQVSDDRDEEVNISFLIIYFIPNFFLI